MSLAALIRAPLAAIDERVNLKHVHRRLQVIARVLIISTFVDDTLRVACDYSGQVESMRVVGFGEAAAQVLPALFVVVQATGSLCVLVGRSQSTEAGCALLIAWTAIHPFLYQQQKNVEFLIESLSIIGGLCILLSSTRAIRRHGDLGGALLPGPTDRSHGGGGGGDGGAAPTSADAVERADKLQLVGRACLSSLYVFYAFKGAHERVLALFSDGAAEAPGVALVEYTLLGMLAPLAALLVVGMRSRWCALVLALATACAALYSHPWYLALWSSRREFTLDNVIGYEGTKVDAWIYATHQRYFFFQQISAAGALLQLVVHGPGRYSLQPEGTLRSAVAPLTAKGVD